MINNCTTEKNAAANRFYHNLTAKYNGYFNARELIKESLNRFNANYTDRYYELLPIELYPVTEKETEQFEADMEIAIEKCEKVIQRHSMPSAVKNKKKEEEWGKWIDDNWLLIGEASYLKGDYANAIQKLEYVRKFYKNESAVYESELWLARTHLTLNNIPEAVKYLEMVNAHLEDQKLRDEEKKKASFSDRRKQKEKNKRKGIVEPAEVPKYMQGDYHLLKAAVYIKQNDKGKAIMELEEALEFIKKRKRKGRIYFVLAQLHHDLGDNTKSMDYYKKVIKSSAKYPMRFNAKINRAMQGSGEDLKRELKKLLRDSKNKDYKDQIYFALAEIEWNEGDKETAVENYKKSTFYSTSNNRQKGVSYLKLADIHFNDKKFESAKIYYDSAAAFLPPEYPNYVSIKNKGESLNELVNNINIVTKQDSLQKIAGMPEKEREQYLADLVKQIEKEREEKKKEQEKQLLTLQDSRTSQTQDVGSGANWYFYNVKLMGEGANEFKRTFGERVLEDNWRRKDKSAAFSDFNNVDEEGENSEQPVKKDSISVELLSKGLPLTDSALAISNEKIYTALYRLGVIYKEDLKDYKSAIERFEDILKRTDAEEHALPALYQLYLTYNADGNSTMAEAKKMEILNNYPNSDFANLIRDPDFMRRKEEEKLQDLRDYITVVESYESRNYGIVIARCNKIIYEDTANQFLPKYMLLKIFAIGQTRGNTYAALTGPIEELVNKFPQTEEGKYAAGLLEKIKNPKDPAEKEEVFEAPSSFTLNKDEKHMFVVIVNQSKGSEEELRSMVDDYHERYFKGKNLKVNSSLFGTDSYIIMVQFFEGATPAMEYYEAFQKTRHKVVRIRNGTEFFVIGNNNFSIFFKAKNTDDYKKFFKENYLN